MWNLNDAAQKALLASQPGIQKYLIGTGISFEDGTGTGGRDVIGDNGGGLGAFGIDDMIMVVGGTNHGKLVAALSVAAGSIEVPAGSFADESSGDPFCLIMISSGSFAQVFRNSYLDIYSDIRPTNANLVENGTKLLQLTRNGGAFTYGNSANGLNFGAFSGNILTRAIDPATGLPEVWRGPGLVTGTPGWGRLRSNGDYPGASTDRPRADGVVEVSGADINLSTGKSVTAGVYSELTNFRITIAGAALAV